MDNMKNFIAEQVVRMGAGGLQASQAIGHLLAIATEPHAREIMAALGVEAAAARLMKSASSDDRLQGLAGSILTFLSGMPVTAEISDENSASYGQVHIVVPRPSRVYKPDQVMIDLDSGVRPSEAA